MSETQTNETAAPRDGVDVIYTGGYGTISIPDLAQFTRGEVTTLDDADKAFELVIHKPSEFRLAGDSKPPAECPCALHREKRENAAMEAKQKAEAEAAAATRPKADASTTEQQITGRTDARPKAGRNVVVGSTSGEDKP